MNYAISGRKLKQIRDFLKFFSDALIEFLLDRAKQPEETQMRLKHIRGLKDIKVVLILKNNSPAVEKNS